MLLLLRRGNAVNLGPQTIIGQIEMREAQHDGRVYKMEQGLGAGIHWQLKPFTVLTQRHVKEAVG